MMCGAGALDIAVVLTGILLAINIGLRPLVNWLDGHLIAGLRPATGCTGSKSAGRRRRKRICGLLCCTN